MTSVDIIKIEFEFEFKINSNIIQNLFINVSNGYTMVDK